MEGEISNLWEKNNANETLVDHYNGEKFSTTLPPPNVTGRLHIGHALNSSYQDILIRYKRMEGYDVKWIPGTDHAGLATENAVAKHLLKQGKTKNSMTKEEFLVEANKWTNEYGNIILDQIKRMGCSCTWSMQRFTKDENFSNLVRKVFVQLYHNKLIYKGPYLVNWCSKCNTALSDDEVNTNTSNGSMYYIKYRVEDGSYVTVATTRPETIFGDVAIAYNPADERHKHLKNLKCYIPIIDKLIPFVEDHSIKMEFGTGVMKVTPAHDRTDNEIGVRHKLPIVNIINNFGKICNTNTKYDGKKTHIVRQELVADLVSTGLIEKIDPYECTNKTCYRCDTNIDNIVSEQWFVRMKTMAEKALLLKDEMNFYPEYQKTIYTHWLTNINDWCISRNIHYGHDIPVWKCEECRHYTVVEIDATSCVSCGSKKLVKEPDMLDTWFSSWLWSFGVFDKDANLNKYYPLDVIVSGSDILFFWISRMVMASLEITEELPFKDIYLHGIIRDEKNRKMAKTLGNGIDPLTIIDKFGADCLRFSLVFNTPNGKDAKIGLHSFDTGRGLCTKLWNASRYVLMSLPADFKYDRLLNVNNEINKWIIAKLNKTICDIKENLACYDFFRYVHDIYTFMWDEFCSYYLELTKKMVNIEEIKIETYNTLIHIIVNLCKVFHPVIPFITEQIYQNMVGILNLDEKILMLSKFPASVSTNFEDLNNEMEKLKVIQTCVRKKESITDELNNTYEKYKNFI
jgi:valyl-tRNA synthetase